MVPLGKGGVAAAKITAFNSSGYCRVRALNCNAFGILLCYASLYVYASRYFFENKQFCSKFRALSRGAISFSLSLFV